MTSFNRSRRRHKMYRGPRQEEKYLAGPLAKKIPPLKVENRLRELLARIGRPDSNLFRADPFQTEAIETLKSHDLIVSAPTGSGKTYIASESIKAFLSQDGRVWYATPLKALSNAKYLEFGQLFGEERVGLLTGDHRVNLEAPVIVGTTEILRNQLYDVMSQGRDLNLDLVVLDEAHYLGDPDRGVVWEEVLIYLPSRVRLLLLSATIGNAAEIADWLSRNRGQEVKTVLSFKRPVPLYPLALTPPANLIRLMSRGRLNPALAHGLKSRRARTGDQASQFMSTAKVMAWLKEANLLPAIFFLKSRADCDTAVKYSGGNYNEDPARYEARQKAIASHLARYPFLARHRHLPYLREKAVAAHHAGHLPHYKILVENLMAQGLLSAIFATSTVAAGVNFPARTVVIRQSDRFDGHTFNDLTVTELLQMTGRAGRRGHDQVGFAVALPGQHMNLKLLAALFNASPDPVVSQLTVNFSMVLNLLNSYRPTDVEGILKRSLAAYQLGRGRLRPDDRPGDPDLLGSFKKHLQFLRRENLVDARGDLTEDGRWAAHLRLDHPLVMYAGIKAGAWPEESPDILAALTAGLLADKQGEGTLPRRKPPALSGAFNKLLLAVGPMTARLVEAGFPAPTISLRPAWAIWSWAREHNFDKAVDIFGLDAGDLAMLVYRTADHLRQLTALRETWPALGEAARRAIGLILKEPVTVPL